MPRQLRIQHDGAIYHLMSRGDRREEIFHDDLDREDFLKTLGAACQKTGWQVHAYCLLLLCCNHRTRSEKHQAEEVFFDIELLNTLRQDSPRFVVWPWSCGEREVEEHPQEGVQDPSQTTVRKLRPERNNPSLLI